MWPGLTALPQWCQVKQWDDLQRKKHTKSWSFSMGCPFFCWPAPLSLNCWTWGRLRCLEMLWKGWSFFTFPQSWRDDIRPTFQDFKKLSIRCGATKIHRFQQPQVRVPAPTANRPRCRWDRIFFFCWKIGIRKLGKRQSPSKPIILVSILGFLCVFLIENRYPRESARGETRGIVCTCTSWTSPRLGIFVDFNLRFSSTLVLYSHVQ